MKRIAVICATLLLSSCHDLRLYEIYSSADEARADGGVERGWLPDWLPDNAVDIHDHHDLDTNIRAISFSLTNDENFAWPEHCTSAASAFAPGIKTRLFPPSIHRREGIKDCVDLFVFEDDRGRVYAWSTHRGR